MCLAPIQNHSLLYPGRHLLRRRAFCCCCCCRCCWCCYAWPGWPRPPHIVLHHKEMPTRTAANMPTTRTAAHTATGCSTYWSQLHTSCYSYLQLHSRASRVLPGWWYQHYDCVDSLSIQDTATCSKTATRFQDGVDTVDCALPHCRLRLATSTALRALSWSCRQM